MHLASRPSIGIATLLAATVASTAIAQDPWVEFTEATADRLVLDELYRVNDNLEKDFAWADFDQNGFTDLVVMRKFPGSVEGGAKNLLLMNEGGVLVDRTDNFAINTDHPSDLGFLTPTNDRDVKILDIDLDGWVDLVTATTMSDNLNAREGQPRIYRNQGLDQNGNWLGFRFEDDRIPQLFAKNGSAANPRACAIAVGDVTNDGYPDIYFVDYDTPETSGMVCIDLNMDGDTNDVVDGVAECNPSPGETPSMDYDGKLLVNLGAANPGFFEDSTTTRMSASQLAMAFGNECVIRDVNGDGLNDVIRVNTLTSGQDIAVIYQTNGMSWVGPQTITGGAPYGMNAGDLNNDGRVDVISADDGQDAYMINNGNNGSGYATWTRYTIADSLGEFGNSIQIADLNDDGWNDVMIADVDSDLPPFCPSSGRRMHIYRNTGVTSALLDEDGTVLPLWALDSTYDAAPIDIDNDGALDLVIGACYGFSVWMNQPAVRIEFEYPTGIPTTVLPNSQTIMGVTLNAIGSPYDAGSGRLWSSIDGATFTASPLQGAGELLDAMLPAIDCGQELRFYVTADNVAGATFRSPNSGWHEAIAQTGLDVVLEDDMESGDGDWTTDADATTTAGFWERAVPIGTINGGIEFAPSEDATAKGTQCWVTQNGQPGGSAGAADVDNGAVYLTSPTFDLSDGDAVVGFKWWVVNDDFGTSTEDRMLVEISNGGDWITVMAIANGTPGWNDAGFNVADYVEPTSTVNLRFTASDNPNNSLMECGIDDLRISRVECVSAPNCPEDLNGDGSVTGADLGLLLAAWGTAGADLNGDGNTNGADLGLLLAAFGTDC
ncbi:MAG: hypothetical protein GWP75_11460 [Planctomycetia bacterium]|nr:hypothetical protein [Planctomycetia bacterium]